jgi:hypothetical protein
MTMGDRIRPSRKSGTAPGGPNGQPAQHPVPPPHRPGGAAATPNPAPIADQAPRTDDTAGDPVCWLDKVCPTCGLLTGTDDTTCPRCGDALPH